MSDLPTNNRSKIADDFSCCQTYREQRNWVIAAVIVRHNRERSERTEWREMRERIELEGLRNWERDEWKRIQGKSLSCSKKKRKSKQPAEFSYLIGEEIRMMMEDLDERQVSLFDSDEESASGLNNLFLSDEEESVFELKDLFLSDES